MKSIFGDTYSIEKQDKKATENMCGNIFKPISIFSFGHVLNSVALVYNPTMAFYSNKYDVSLYNTQRAPFVVACIIIIIYFIR